MKAYVLDANALVRWYRNAAGADTVEKVVDMGRQGNARVCISVVNLTEVVYVLAKYFQHEHALRLVHGARGVLETMPVDDQVALDTGAVRVRYKMSLADCFAAELAMRLNATLVTADPEFAKLGKPLKVLALPRHTG